MMENMFISAKEASPEDDKFTQDVEDCIDWLENIFEKRGTPCVIAATVCAISVAVDNGLTIDEFCDQIREFARAYNIGRKHS
jgi:hypothetical protein